MRKWKEAVKMVDGQTEEAVREQKMVGKVEVESVSEPWRIWCNGWC